MALLSRPTYPIIPGSGHVYDFWITDKATGAEKLIAEYTLEATLRVGGETIALTVTPKSTTRYSIEVGAGVTAPNEGRRGLMRAWATPSSGIEASAIEATLVFG